MCTAAIMCFLCIGLGSPDARLFPRGVQTLCPGMRVRVNAPAQEAKPVVGTLTDIDPFLLTIQTSKERVPVRREAILAVWRSERRSQKKKAALIGAGVGLAAALILAAADNQDPFLGGVSGGELALAYSILFVPAGAGVGAIIAPGERWVTVPISTVGAARSPRRRGLEFSVSVRF